MCPRDIDYKHIQHCLDALDMWAFPEGPRRSLPKKDAEMDHFHHGHSENSLAGVNSNTQRDNEYVIDESDETRLVWRTKVCFNSKDVAP